MYKFLVVSIFLLYTIFNPAFAVEPTHTALNRCEDTLTMPSGSNTECVTTPQYYRVHIVEMGVCNNIDAFTKPTAAGYDKSNWDIHSKCAKFFEATNGSVPLLIENGVSQSFSSIGGGKILRPPNGTYTHGYALITGVIEIEGGVKFSPGTNATGVEAVSGGPSPNGTGNFCWTNGTGAYSWASGPQTKCGNSIDDSFQESSVFFTNLHTAGDCSAGDGPDFYCNFYSTGPFSDVSENLDPTTAILLDKDFNLSSSEQYGSGTGQVQYLLGIATYNSPLVINDNTSAIDTQFKVTRGFHVYYGDNLYSAWGVSRQVNLGLLEWKTVTRAQ